AVCRGCKRFLKELLHARWACRRNDDERPARSLLLIRQGMDSAAWNMDEIPRFGADRLPTRPKRYRALQDVESLVLEVVNVGRRAASGRKQALEDEAVPARFRPRDKKGDAVARPQVHRP